MGPVVTLLVVAHATEPQLLGQDRLPDFSWAGYQQGKEPPMDPAQGSVLDLGAVPDDGLSDHEAFQRAADEGDKEDRLATLTRLQEAGERCTFSLAGCGTFAGRISHVPARTVRPKRENLRAL